MSSAGARSATDALQQGRGPTLRLCSWLLHPPSNCELGQAPCPLFLVFHSVMGLGPSLLRAQSSGFWEGARGPQMGGGSVHGYGELSPPPYLVLILLLLSPVSVALLGSRLPCPRPGPWWGFCPQETRHVLRQGCGSNPVGEHMRSRSQPAPPFPAEEASPHGSVHHDGRELQGAGP